MTTVIIDLKAQLDGWAALLENIIYIKERAVRRKVVQPSGEQEVTDSDIISS